MDNQQSRRERLFVALPEQTFALTARPRTTRIGRRPFVALAKPRATGCRVDRERPALTARNRERERVCRVNRECRVTRVDRRVADRERLSDRSAFAVNATNGRAAHCQRDKVVFLAESRTKHWK